MIDNLAIVEESHLEDPDGAVERRLRMYSRSDVLQIKELEDILAAPSPKPSAIVRHWPEKMWLQRDDKKVLCDGRVAFCATGILAEVSGFAWGDPDFTTAQGEQGWGGEYNSESAYWIQQRYGLACDQTKVLMKRNDNEGKEAAANYLASLGL